MCAHLAGDILNNNSKGMAMLRNKTHHFLLLLIFMAIFSLACRVTDIYSDMFINVLESNFGPDLLYGDDTQQEADDQSDEVQPDAEIQPVAEVQTEDEPQTEADMPQDVDIQPDADRWDIYQCNAIQEVNITLTEFEEFQYEDGVVECSYGYEITNLDDIRIIYHSYFHYGDVEPVSHDDGWVSHGFGPNLEVYTLRSSLSNCPNCTPVRWESVLLTIAVIYDRPECEWITENGVHFDVMYIAEEEPVMCPCTLLYPEHFPDITEGLIRN